jgi:hypothetical protein
MSLTNKTSKSRSPVNIDKILERSKSANEIIKDWIGFLPLIPGIATYLARETTVISNLSVDLPSLLLLLLFVAAILPLLMNVTQKEQTPFESFKTRNDTFDYFKDRMNGENGRERAERIGVTYFADLSTNEENDEKKYFKLQNSLVLANKLEVRRILLIKNEADYKKMRQQLEDLGESPIFQLGIYIILAEDINTTTEGNFRRHLNFNFMVIDDKEFCFNNGNRYAEYSTSSITHKKLTEEMNKHIKYLWDNSHKVKISGRDYFEKNILDRIENECKSKQILPPDYTYTSIR